MSFRRAHYPSHWPDLATPQKKPLAGAAPDVGRYTGLAG